MGKSIKINRKLLKKFNLKTLLIIICILVMLVCLYIIFKPDDMSGFNMPRFNLSFNLSNGPVKKSEAGKFFENIGNAVKDKFKGKQEFNEEQAKEKAVDEFKKLGENVNKDSLKVYEVERNNEKNFFIKSQKNTMEVQKSNGQIVRINGNKVLDGVEIVKIEGQTGKQISKDQAVKAAIAQFKKLGENVKESELTVKEVNQKGEKYYYIKSPENSIQIQINGGKIVRINNVNV